MTEIKKLSELAPNKKKELQKIKDELTSRLGTFIRKNDLDKSVMNLAGDEFNRVFKQIENKLG